MTKEQYEKLKEYIIAVAVLETVRECQPMALRYELDIAAQKEKELDKLMGFGE